MKLDELYDVSQQKGGTYAGFKLDDASKQKILDFQEQYDIPNPVPADDLHATLLFSRNHLPEYAPSGNLSPGYVGIPNGFDVWNDALVMKIDSEQMSNRHNELMATHNNATWDHPSYNPHVTMSYDIGGVDASALDPQGLNWDSGDLTFNDEYGEELDLDWTDGFTKDPVD